MYVTHKRKSAGVQWTAGMLLRAVFFSFKYRFNYSFGGIFLLILYVVVVNETFRFR